MENHALTTPNLEMIRVALTTQEENLQRLRSIVSRIQGETLRELRQELSEQLNQLEEIEHRIWAAFFPPDSFCDPEPHRMTMTYVSYTEKYY